MFSLNWLHRAQFRNWGARSDQRELFLAANAKRSSSVAATMPAGVRQRPPGVDRGEAKANALTAA